MSTRSSAVIKEALKGLVYPVVATAIIVAVVHFTGNSFGAQCEELHPKKGTLYDECVAANSKH